MYHRYTCTDVPQHSAHLNRKKEVYQYCGGHPKWFGYVRVLAKIPVGTEILVKYTDFPISLVNFFPY